MSGEIEAAGAMVTAGLAAGAIEGREPGEAGEGACLNCGAQLTGRFCSACGQAAHPHRTLAGVLEEFLHGVLHFDAKAWRTLPMVIFRPGTLTRNYVHGKRARYISPLALFLFTIFAMFFAFAFIPPSFNVAAPNAAMRTEVTAELEAARAALAEAAAQADAAPAAQERLHELEREVAALERIEAVSGADAGARTWQTHVAAAAKQGDLVVITGFDELNARVNKKLENPDYALYKVQQTAYKFSFLLAPLSLPFIALLFLWKRGLTLYDHMVFALYALSFAALLLIFFVITAQWRWSEWLGEWAFAFGLPVHAFFHLKGGYGLGWFSALWRTFFMLIFATIILAIFLLAIFILGLGAA